MPDLKINAGLVGQKVSSPARPEWGVGTVLRIQATRVGGKPAHRVSIQFATGHRTLVVPPARITAPQATPQREAGWLDEIGGQTLDDRLTKLPETVTSVLGGPRERIGAIAALYRVDAGPAGLVDWARRQIGTANPLSLWSRDELSQAFAAFCDERDVHLRIAAARLKQAEGPDALAETLATLPDDVREAMTEVLRRVI